MQPEPEFVHRVFEVICETRRLNKAGYVHFRNFLLYGERGLAKQEAMVNIFQDMLTLEHQEEKLSRYSVEWQPDDWHFARVGNPRLYQHPYQSPQLELWEAGSVEWFVIIRVAPLVRRRKRPGRVIVVQPPLLPDGTQG